jgi:hypothetical protein
VRAGRLLLSVVTLLVPLAVTGTLFAQVMKTNAPPPKPVAAPLECASHEDKQHLVGLALDAGRGPYTATARYLHGHRSGQGCGGLGATFWFGYGAELGVADSAAMIAQAVGRAGIAGDAMAMGVELAGGAATDFDRPVATGSAAFFFSLYYVELGVSYHFPIAADRPPWLSETEFALRAYIPVLTYDVHDKRTYR